MLDLDAMIADVRAKKAQDAKVNKERLVAIHAAMKDAFAPLLDIMRVECRRDTQSVFITLRNTRGGAKVAAIMITPKGSYYKLQAKFGNHETTATASAASLSAEEAVEQLLWSLRDQLFHLIDWILDGH